MGRCRTAEKSGAEGEADFDGHLIMVDLAVHHMAAGLDHLEPADILERARSPRDRALDRVLDARRRRADQLDDLVDVVRHELPSPSEADAAAYARLGEEPTNAGRRASERLSRE